MNNEEQKPIILPSSEEILKRLLSVSTNEKLQKHYYPLITKTGDEERFDGYAVQLIFVAAIGDIEVKLREEYKKFDYSAMYFEYAEAVWYAKYFLSRFIEAFLEGYPPEVLKQALTKVK